jgi:hypothetical protein
MSRSPQGIVNPQGRSGQRLGFHLPRPQTGKPVREDTFLTLEVWTPPGAKGKWKAVLSGPTASNSLRTARFPVERTPTGVCDSKDNDTVCE